MKWQNGRPAVYTRSGTVHRDVRGVLFLAWTDDVVASVRQPCG